VVIWNEASLTVYDGECDEMVEMTLHDL